MSEGAEEEAPKKKRKKSVTPTARSLKECRKRGWPAQTVEQTIPRTFIKRDLFGVIDIVAITPDGILGIQTTGDNGGDVQRRRRKILDEPRAKAWLKAGASLTIWGWGKRGDQGERKLATLREVPIAVEDFAA